MVVAVPTVLLALITWYTVEEPQRGISEAALQARAQGLGWLQLVAVNMLNMPAEMWTCVGEHRIDALLIPMLCTCESHQQSVRGHDFTCNAPGFAG